MATLDNWGEAIDLSEIKKAKRGATVHLEQGLLDFLSKTLSAGQAVALTGFTIDPKKFPDEKDAGNERQRIGAVIRRHVNHLRDEGLIPDEKVSINWHPEADYPQISFKS